MLSIMGIIMMVRPRCACWLSGWVAPLTLLLARLLSSDGDQ
jgi:hypothetical protein